MNLSEIVTAARQRLEDETQPYLFSTSRLEYWANEANIEACRRSRYLVDNTQSVSLVSGTSDYDNPDNVIFIKRGKISSEDMPLFICSYKDMDEIPGWETHTGTPTHLILDMSFDKFKVYPIPDAAYTLNLVTINEPETLTNDINIPARFGYSYVDWICFRAYQTKDVETFDKQLSLECLAHFENEFGTRSSAKDEIYNFRNRPLNGFDGDF